MTQKNRNIQPQAEPYIVKSHDIHIDADCADWIAGTKHRHLFSVKNIEKLKQLVSVIGAEKMHQVGAEKMHQVGAELMTSKLHQCVGELQFAVNHGIMSQAKNNWLSVYASCKRNCGRQNV